MKIRFRIFFTNIFLGLLLWINFSLYFSQTSPSNNISPKHECVQRLNFLEEELKQEELGLRMQEVFPEGLVFVNVLYGLSWCEVARKCDKESVLYSRALAEARFAFSEIDKDDSKYTFPSYLEPEYGIFYQGWSNYLLSNIIDIQNSASITLEEREASINKCAIISEAFNKSSSPFLETYDEQAWPADASIAIASLSLVPSSQNEAVVKRWVSNVKNHLDEYTGMIPHKSDPFTGEVIEGARGCSSSLILRMLSEIDADFASEQFELYQKHFMFTRFGLPAIREYPKGKSGWGDIDSGPVVMGVGFAGTIVAVGVFQKLNEPKLADNLYQTITSFGLQTQSSNQKKVLWGIFPMGDAFITWARLSGSDESSNNSDDNAGNWRSEFHLWSLLFAIILILWQYRKRIFSKNSPNDK